MKQIRNFSAPIGLLLLAAISFGQVERAALTGTIADASGASIPGVKVEAVESATGLHRETITSDAGSFFIGSLPIGVYSVTVSKDAFQTVQYESVRLLVGQSRTLNVQMQ